MNRDETYRGQVGPVFADKRERVIPRALLRRKQLALDVARTEEHFRLEGDFLFADRDSTGTIYVRLNSTAEDAWPLTAQDGVEDVPVQDVFITHAAQVGKVVNLWYGYRARFLAGANSIASIGSILNPVNLDPEDARYFLFGDDESADGEAFVGVAQAGPVAGQISLGYLYNPAGSGKVLYVDGFSVFDSTGVDQIRLIVHNATLGAGASANLSNKRAGGAASVAQLRQGTAAALTGTVVKQIASPSVGGIDQQDFKAPIVLPEGFGFGAWGTTVNHLLLFNIEWREKAT